jgi:rSAM/selenodomain-associated transferase 1
MKAIVVFAKAPISGSVKTRLVPDVSPDDAALLHKAFVLDTLERLAGHGLADVWLACSPSKDHPFFMDLCDRFALKAFDQTGGDLGQRMKAGINFLCSRGYEKILVLGSDSPSLPLEMIDQVFELMEEKKTVLGPSLDGGYYLLGLCGDAPDIFSGIEWGRSSVFYQTVERLKQNKLKYSLLPYWYDVDTIHDLRYLSIQLSTSPEDFCPETRKIMERLKEKILYPVEQGLKSEFGKLD